MIRWFRASIPNPEKPRVFAKGHFVLVSRSMLIHRFIFRTGIVDSGQGSFAGERGEIVWRSKAES